MQNLRVGTRSRVCSPQPYGTSYANRAGLRKATKRIEMTVEISGLNLAQAKTTTWDVVILLCSVSILIHAYGDVRG
jgi:hypothetical protein